MMLLCEFCVRYKQNGECSSGLSIPKRMSCREFDPSVERFCSNPADFVSEAQLAQMAKYFDIKGAELEKVRAVASRETARRAAIARMGECGGTSAGAHFQESVK